MAERLCELDVNGEGVRETHFKQEFGLRLRQGHRTWRRLKGKLISQGFMTEVQKDREVSNR